LFYVRKLAIWNMFTRLESIGVLLCLRWDRGVTGKHARSLLTVVVELTLCCMCLLSCCYSAFHTRNN
jgi:hypothetical protein